MTTCDLCVDAFEPVILALGELGCDAMGATFEAACGVAAALLPPPADVMAELGCAVAAAALVALCNKYGWQWIHEHPREVAEMICKKMDIC